MGDMFSPGKRSEIMSHIRSKETHAEKIAFRYLRQEKIYFQKHYKRAVGKPDIALPRQKKAVFIDGDFWHGRHYARIIKSRPPGDYWINKIASNSARDVRQRNALIEQGWIILAIWESDIKRIRTRQETLRKIKLFLAPDE